MSFTSHIARLIRPAAQTKTPSTYRLADGFTLIELLVVIAVIAVLAGILIPIASSARASAQNSECVSNLRQIGVAIGMYVSEHNHSYPERIQEGDESDKAWSWKLAPYLGYQDLMGPSPKARSVGVFVCPSHADEKVEARHASYAYNGFIRSILWNYNQLKIPNPANVFVAVEIDKNVETFNPIAEQVATRHANNSANFLFADGHVESIENANEGLANDPRWRWW